MASLTDIGHWISENEALLSGIVALVVLTGLVLSPVGKLLLHLLGRRSEKGAQVALAEVLPEDMDMGTDLVFLTFTARPRPLRK